MTIIIHKDSEKQHQLLMILVFGRQHLLNWTRKKVLQNRRICHASITENMASNQTMVRPDL